MKIDTAKLLLLLLVTEIFTFSASGNKTIIEQKRLKYKSTLARNGQNINFIIKLNFTNQNDIDFELEVDDKSRCKKSIMTKLKY